MTACGSEKDAMLRGDLYNPQDAELVGLRLRARHLLRALNRSVPDDPQTRAALLDDLFNAKLDGVYIEPPFYCDYGLFISLGRNVYMNFGCTILDVCPVTIGDNVLFGPNVQVYAASHPVQAEARRSGLENGAPVIIGSDAWIGGQSVILPGVSIGEGTVIGAGSVVTRDIPAGVLAAGNPCRVIKRL